MNSLYFERFYVVKRRVWLRQAKVFLFEAFYSVTRLFYTDLVQLLLHFNFLVLEFLLESTVNLVLFILRLLFDYLKLAHFPNFLQF